MLNKNKYLAKQGDKNNILISKIKLLEDTWRNIWKKKPSKRSRSKEVIQLENSHAIDLL